MRAAARGETAAVVVSAAGRVAPDGAAVTTGPAEEGLVAVTVRAPVRPLGAALLSVTVESTATARVEPGVAGAPGTRSEERGSASVWVVALAGVLVLVGLGGALLAAAVLARHRATAAADLAALAATGSAVDGEADPCAAAAGVAAANGGRLRSCTVDPAAVSDVVVGVPVDLGPLGAREATGRARAGPVTGPSSP